MGRTAHLSSDYLSICFSLKLAAICVAPSNTCLCGYFNTAVIIEFGIFLFSGIFIRPGWLFFKDPNTGPDNFSCTDCHVLGLWLLCVEGSFPAMNCPVLLGFQWSDADLHLMRICSVVPWLCMAKMFSHLLSIPY